MASQGGDHCAFKQVAAAELPVTVTSHLHKRLSQGKSRKEYNTL